MAHTMVIFGASGDLTSRKLIPALYRLFEKGRLPDETRVVGVSRSKFSTEQWREQLGEAVAQYVGASFDLVVWRRFADYLYYHPGDAQRQQDYQSLSEFLDALEGEGRHTRLFYLSTKPQLYGPIIRCLGQAGMVDESAGPRRVVIEKPFGTSRETARELNRTLHAVVHESQVYRIDHYLGKETVQNLLVLRFANSIFEPIWNRHFIDHVQITVAEAVDVGHRGGYYDTSGVLRDMFQNHLLQLLTITAMETPVEFQAELIRDEKVKVLRAIRQLTSKTIKGDTVRAQYRGYRAEKDVPTDSQTATFAALRLMVDNWRWNGVPFYLRSGKAMSCRTTQIVIQFRAPPQLMFAPADGDCDPLTETPLRQPCEANRLVVQIQPAEGIQLHLQSKVPDGGMRTRMTELDYRFQRDFVGDLPDAYQRLILDALTGDASLFARSDEVELAWGVIDPILNAWHDDHGPAIQEYEPGGWGPEVSSEWMREHGREWFDVCPGVALDPFERDPAGSRS